MSCARLAVFAFGSSSDRFGRVVVELVEAYEPSGSRGDQSRGAVLDFGYEEQISSKKVLTSKKFEQVKITRQLGKYLTK